MFGTKDVFVEVDVAMVRRRVAYCQQARVPMITTSHIEQFVSARTGQPWRSLAPPVDSSGRRTARIFTGTDGTTYFVKYATGPHALTKMHCE